MDNRDTLLSVPGNLLLFGEYAVLEDGGLGIAVAPEIRVRVSLGDAENTRIRGIFGGTETVWSPEDQGSAVLFREIITECCGSEKRFLSLFDHREIVIDSTQFYSESGKKRGFGSSAAVSVALAALLLDSVSAGRDDPVPAAAAAALKAHRRMQQGRGSGYDIYTSAFGGIGLFTGGESPSWRPIGLPWLPPLSLFPGRAPVRSVSAVDKYYAWKHRYPGRARLFLEQSNRDITAFASSGSWEEAVIYAKRLRDISRDLGEEIDAPAELEPPGGTESLFFKASGAGNELGFILDEGERTENPDFVPVSISRDGIRWT